MSDELIRLDDAIALFDAPNVIEDLRALPTVSPGVKPEVETERVFMDVVWDATGFRGTPEQLINAISEMVRREPRQMQGAILRAALSALTEQLTAARQDAKEAEAYAEELENEAVLSKAAYEGVSSLLLSVQQDCIKERQRAERLEAKLAKAVATERARIVKLLDGIDRTELDDNGWWETSFGAKFGEGILNAILKGESHE